MMMLNVGVSGLSYIVQPIVLAETPPLKFDPSIDTEKLDESPTCSEIDSLRQDFESVLVELKKTLSEWIAGLTNEKTHVSVCESSFAEEESSSPDHAHRKHLTDLIERLKTLHERSTMISPRVEAKLTKLLPFVSWSQQHPIPSPEVIQEVIRHISTKYFPEIEAFLNEALGRHLDVEEKQSKEFYSLCQSWISLSKSSFKTAAFSELLCRLLDSVCRGEDIFYVVKRKRTQLENMVLELSDKFIREWRYDPEHSEEIDLSTEFATSEKRLKGPRVWTDSYVQRKWEAIPGLMDGFYHNIGVALSGIQVINKRLSKQITDVNTSQSVTFSTDQLDQLLVELRGELNQTNQQLSQIFDTLSLNYFLTSHLSFHAKPAEEFCCELRSLFLACAKMHDHLRLKIRKSNQDSHSHKKMFEQEKSHLIQLKRRYESMIHRHREVSASLDEELLKLKEFYSAQACQSRSDWTKHGVWSAHKTPRLLHTDPKEMTSFDTKFNQIYDTCVERISKIKEVINQVFREMDQTYMWLDEEQEWIATTVSSIDLTDPPITSFGKDHYGSKKAFRIKKAAQKGIESAGSLFGGLASKPWFGWRS